MANLLAKLQPGDTFAKRFDEKGEVHFACAPVPWMKSTTIVI
jgi:hypothetical protein